MRLKEKKKRLIGKCSICGDDNYSILDCHRIEPGSKYTEWGILVLCSNCHRKVHAEQIKILGKYNSTGGVVINYIDENGEDIWKNE